MIEKLPCLLLSIASDKYLQIGLSKPFTEYAGGKSKTTGVPDTLYKSESANTRTF